MLFRALRVLFGPAWSAARVLLRPPLTYAPDGMETRIGGQPSKGWNFEGVVEAERMRWESFRRNLSGTGPLGFSHEHDDPSEIRNVSFHNIHMTFAYVVALASRGKTAISILDYGGGLGHYYLLAKAVVPGLELEFHCKEVPRIADSGRNLLPEVAWHTEDTCLDRTYDLVMVNGSLQYLDDWKGSVARLARSSGDCLLLTRVPVVELAATFATVQRAYGTEMLHRIFNREELLDTVTATGLVPMREFIVGDRPYTRSAPEQPELRGWLFRRPVETPSEKAKQ